MALCRLEISGRKNRCADYVLVVALTEITTRWEQDISHLICAFEKLTTDSFGWIRLIRVHGLQFRFLWMFLIWGIHYLMWFITVGGERMIFMTEMLNQLHEASVQVSVIVSKQTKQCVAWGLACGCQDWFLAPSQFLSMTCVYSVHKVS